MRNRLLSLLSLLAAAAFSVAVMSLTGLLEGTPAEPSQPETLHVASGR